MTMTMTHKSVLGAMGISVPELDLEKFGVSGEASEAMSVFFTLVKMGVESTGVVHADMNEQYQKDMQVKLIEESLDSFNSNGGYAKERAAMDALDLSDLYLVNEVVKRVVDYGIELRAKADF